MLIAERVKLLNVHLSVVRSSNANEWEDEGEVEEEVEVEDEEKGGGEEEEEDEEKGGGEEEEEEEEEEEGEEEGARGVGDELGIEGKGNTRDAVSADTIFIFICFSFCRSSLFSCLK